MPNTAFRIWGETAHNAALRCGGWAYVRAEGAALSGAAGGERTSSPERMALAGLPAPDLFIRTGGELRISNFLLWQLAYTELWFTDALWPDVDDALLQSALDDYARRERRFGLTSAQVKPHAPGGTT